MSVFINFLSFDNLLVWIFVDQRPAELHFPSHQIKPKKKLN